MSTAIATAKRQINWTPRNTYLYQWFERDRAHVRLETAAGETIIELWDEEVAEFGEGFKGLRQSWAEALIEYANDRHRRGNKIW